ncbi:MAG: hypothetical protein JKY65_32025 [Planctomycetes bacterium]|nr:hypothetical protein [Planctomycetota bacterium]
MTLRERRIAHATWILLGGGLLLTQVVEPGWKRYRDLSQEHELAEGILDRERALATRVVTLVKRRQELQETLAPKEGSLVPWLMGHVRELSQEAGFKPRSLRFVSAQPLGDAKKAGAFLELKLELRTKTSPKKLQDFLVRLAASERHVRVRSLTTVPDPKGRIEATLLLLALVPRDATRGLEVQ